MNADVYVASFKALQVGLTIVELATLSVFLLLKAIISEVASAILGVEVVCSL